MSETTTPVRRARATTVVWGIILVVIATVSFALVAYDIGPYRPEFAVWTVIFVGLLLVAAAVVGVVVHFFNNRGASAEGSSGPTAD